MGPPQWSDMGMWLQSVMLLLVEHGLASCPQECWAMYGETVRRTLGLDDGQILFTGLAIGYADEGAAVNQWPVPRAPLRSEEHTSELQSLMRISYAVFCLKKKKKTRTKHP